MEAEQQQQQQAAPAPAFTYMKSPGQSNDLLNYATTQGQKIYYENTKGASTKFELESSSLLRALEDILAHAHAAGWTHEGANIIDIPSRAGTKNIITHFSQLTEDEVKAHALTYLGRPSRQEQNSEMMHTYLVNSLSESAKNKLLAQRDFYIVNQSYSGPLFFFLMMRKVCTSNEATILQLRDSLTHLDSYMATVTWNIDVFNQHVQELRDGLLSRGATVHDSELILQLFRAYGVVSDSNFTRYIETLRNNYEDQLRIVTPDELMQLALNKYQTLKLRGEWTQPTHEAKQLQALSAQVAALKDKQLKLSESKRRDKKDKKGNKKQSKKGNNKHSNTNDNDKWAWLKVAPKEGESQVKTMNDVEWYWCKHHQKWQRHKTDECRLPSEAGKKKGKSNKRLVARGAVEQESDEDSDSGSDSDSDVSI